MDLRILVLLRLIIKNNFYDLISVKIFWKTIIKSNELRIKNCLQITFLQTNFLNDINPEKLLKL